MSNNDESKVPNAPKRSPNNPPGPVTYGVKPFAWAIGLMSSRNAATTAGKTGLSLVKTFAIEFPSSGIFAKMALPSCEGKTEIFSPGAKKSEIVADVPSRVKPPTVARCELIAANVSGVLLPSNKINVGKLKLSLPENLAISSEAFVASAPLGKNEELLFS
ncbi:unannotated protein [freshwater metagenome]|uniref:Unannotated protein n=1 Tax=freshwater metagenome TaxID=449393 RepID=A0A6J7TCE2_9ZZZZ